MEKYRERQRDLHMDFLDLEKAYDNVPHELVTPKRYSRIIKDMYEGAKTRVRTIVGNTEFFPMEVGLHQGSTISPYLFTLILDELSRGIQKSIPWCMIFSDDIVLIVESVEGLNNKLKRVEIRPAMLYGSECWPITKAQANMMEVAELRMMRWTCGKTMVDMIPNGVFRATLDVDSIIDKMRERRLRWFGHVKRRPQTAPVRRVKAMVVKGLRRRDRLKQNMKKLLLSEDMTSDRIAWRDRIRISGFAYALFSFSIPEHLPYAHVYWPKVPWKQSLYFRVYLGGRGMICLHFTYLIPCFGEIGYLDTQTHQLAAHMEKQQKSRCQSHLMTFHWRILTYYLFMNPFLLLKVDVLDTVFKWFFTGLMYGYLTDFNRNKYPYSGWPGLLAALMVVKLSVKNFWPHVQVVVALSRSSRKEVRVCIFVFSGTLSEGYRIGP
nr:uncharacterized protein [Tanacetum cinerariifolium]